MKLEVETARWLLGVPHAEEATGKEWGDALAGMRVTMEVKLGHDALEEKVCLSKGRTYTLLSHTRGGLKQPNFIVTTWKLESQDPLLALLRENLSPAWRYPATFVVLGLSCAILISASLIRRPSSLCVWSNPPLPPCLRTPVTG